MGREFQTVVLGNGENIEKVSEDIHQRKEERSLQEVEKELQGNEEKVIASLE